MSKKSKILKIIALIFGLIILVLGLVLFFLFGGGFKNFEKNRAEAEITPFSSSVKNSGAQLLCESGDKGLDPFSGSGGRHSFTSYYLIKNDAVVQEIKNIAQQKGYVLKEDSEYINNLKDDFSHPKSVPSDRAGITYNAESEYLKSSETPTPGHYLYVRIYRNSDVVLTCTDPWEKQKTTGNSEAILYMFAHGF